jgi:hypothetical protein
MSFFIARMAAKKMTAEEIAAILELDVEEVREEMKKAEQK